MIKRGDLSNQALTGKTLTTRLAPEAKGSTQPSDRDILNEPKLTVEELARCWRVRPETILRDIRKGALRAHRLPGGDLRILVSDARTYGRPSE